MISLYYVLWGELNDYSNSAFYFNWETNTVKIGELQDVMEDLIINIHQPIYDQVKFQTK